MSEPHTPTVTRRPSWSETDRFVPQKFVQPFQRFMHAEAGGAIIMLAAAVAALVWANSPWYHAQEALWDTELVVELGHLAHIDLNLVEWVNDALMAIFFFLVGLEIKRELVHGELRDPKKAALPAIAALGGMLVPAGIYMLVNAGGDAFHGWGIPMATDIAFAVAVVSLVGDKVPAAAKVFLLTLAIADDIGAIIVIALFYTESISLGWGVIALATLAAVEICKRLHIRAMPVYIALALFAWFAFHETGVHATLAGVALGLMTPAWPFYNPKHFGEDMTTLLSSGVALDSIDQMDDSYDDDYDQATARLSEIDRLVTETQSPLDRLEHGLHGWVAFVIVPIFAFANAGVRIGGEPLGELVTEPVVLGIALGLLVGKTIGVFLFTFLGERLGIGRLPEGVTYRHVLGLAICAGIGFTVALFVASLAFEDGSLFTDEAKIGILAGSLLSGTVGYAFLKAGPDPDVPTAADVASDRPEPALVD